MWSHKPASETTRVARYWDRLVTSALGPAREISDADTDPTLVQTIAWLEQMDDTRPASGEFTQRFEHQFLQAIGATSAPPAATQERRVEERSTSLTPREPGDSFARSSRSASTRSHHVDMNDHAMRRILVFMAAAAALMVFVVALYDRFDDREESRHANVILAPSSSLDVPMDRGNPQRSGVMPGPGIRGDLAVRWSFVTGRAGISAPVVAGNTLFVTNWSDSVGNTTDQGAVIAIDAATGSERWQFPTEHAMGVTPAFAGGIVYAGDTSGVVYALDASTGQERWRIDLQRAWTSEPVVAGDLVIIAATSYQSPIHVAVQGDTVVVGSGLVGQSADGFTLYALDRLSGAERWQSGNDRSGQPGLFAFDLESGAQRWQFGMPSLESGPVIADGSVYAGSTLDSTVYALDLTSGKSVWQTSIDADLPLNSSPAVSGGQVFIAAATGAVISLDSGTGQINWQANTEHASLNGSPVVVGQTVYVVDTEFGISAFSVSDGSVLWSDQLALTGQVAASPVVVNGALFIGTSLEESTTYAATLWALAASDGR